MLRREESSLTGELDDGGSCSVSSLPASLLLVVSSSSVCLFAEVRSLLTQPQKCL